MALARRFKMPSAVPPACQILRDPAPLLEGVLRQWGGHDDLWVFGYASLIWRPEFESPEQRPARVQGWHRALRMRSQVNRGTPDCPGLVFALLPGGACRGVAYRVPASRARQEMHRLWEREMVTGVYDPRLLRARTPSGEVQALTFTLSRDSPACLPPLDDQRLLHILRHACGRFGTTLDYLVQTWQALRERGIHDREIERLMGVARRGGLWLEPDLMPRASPGLPASEPA
jgi:cation transport protein ChaC